VLVHGCRYIEELAYRPLLERELADHELLGDAVRSKLVYYPTVTREPFRTKGRIPELIRTRRIFDDLGLEHLDAARDRAMLCGSPAMLEDMTPLLKEEGFDEGTHAVPGQYVVEKAFVER